MRLATMRCCRPPTSAVDAGRIGRDAIAAASERQLAWFPDMPVFTIWNASRELRAPPPDMQWQGEGALLVRRDNVVHWQRIDAGACAFLDACASGVDIGTGLRTRAAGQSCARHQRHAVRADQRRGVLRARAILLQPMRRSIMNLPF